MCDLQVVGSRFKVEVCAIIPRSKIDNTPRSGPCHDISRLQYIATPQSKHIHSFGVSLPSIGGVIGTIVEAILNPTYPNEAHLAEIANIGTCMCTCLCNYCLCVYKIIHAPFNN
jgi:hypothetical protein